MVCERPSQQSDTAADSVRISHRTMHPSDDSDQGLDQETLMKQLNALLASLHLPIPLTSPTDLTPLLLIAILESLTGMRLHITYNHDHKDSKRTHAGKVQAMKIFLGVLETDFLQMDVGISDIDPIRLADGEWEEVLYIAELLCWVGRQAGLVCASNDNMDVKTPSPPPKRLLSPKSQLDLDAEPLYHTDSTITGIERLSERTFSPFLKENEGDSMTSLNTFEDPDEVSLSDTVSDIHGFHHPFTYPPRCIHQVPSPSLLFSVNPQLPPCDRTPSPVHDCDCHPLVANILPIEHGDHPNTQPHRPIRNTGFIQPVDEEAELASFERSRSMSRHSNRHGRDYSEQSVSQKAARLLAIHEQYSRTVYLINERARLLTQLADLKNS